MPVRGRPRARTRACRPRCEASLDQMLRGGRFSRAETTLAGHNVGCATNSEPAGATTSSETASNGQAGVVRPEHRLHLSAAPEWSWSWCSSIPDAAEWLCMCSPASACPPAVPSWHNRVAAKLPRSGSKATSNSRTKTRSDLTEKKLSTRLRPLREGGTLAIARVRPHRAASPFSRALGQSKVRRCCCSVGPVRARMPDLCRRLSEVQPSGFCSPFVEGSRAPEDCEQPGRESPSMPSYGRRIDPHLDCPGGRVSPAHRFSARRSAPRARDRRLDLHVQAAGGPRPAFSGAPDAIGRREPWILCGVAPVNERRARARHRERRDAASELRGMRKAVLPGHRSGS